MQGGQVKVNSEQQLQTYVAWNKRFLWNMRDFSLVIEKPCTQRGKVRYQVSSTVNLEGRFFYFFKSSDTRGGGQILRDSDNVRIKRKKRYVMRPLSGPEIRDFSIYVPNLSRNSGSWWNSGLFSLLNFENRSNGSKLIEISKNSSLTRYSECIGSRNCPGKCKVHGTLVKKCPGNVPVFLSFSYP